ncbi:MAG TPA: glycogen debranching enzyme, partial [Geobacteraceae bacterium]
NLSWNCGVEGPTADAGIESLRNRQVKNFLTVTLLALGTPMLLMGDELRRTQGGNNNAYCQDNETNWFDWGLLERHADVHRFVRLLIDARMKRAIAVDDPDLTLNELLRQGRFEWHGVRLGQPDWGESSHSIALTVWSLNEKVVFHLMVNAYWGPLTFQLPPSRELPGGSWRRWVDTSREAPLDITPLHEAPVVAADAYELPPHSLAVLLARAGKTGSRSHLGRGRHGSDDPAG